MYGRTDGRTYVRTDGRMYGRTKIEKPCVGRPLQGPVKILPPVWKQDKMNTSMEYAPLGAKALIL